MSTIVQFITKSVGGKKQKVGTFVGQLDNEGVIRMGWSRAAVNRGDTFNKNTGLRIATERLKATKAIPVPPSPRQA